MKIYITFGQEHIHKVNGVIFDKDCIAEIECEYESRGREFAVEQFGTKFCTHYLEESLPKLLPHFPRGIIPLNPTTQLDKELQHASAEYEEEEESTTCPYCGTVGVNNCDAPPADICHIALERLSKSSLSPPELGAEPWDNTSDETATD